MENNLSNTNLAFIGCGVMAESIIAGLLRKNLVDAEQIVGQPSARESARGIKRKIRHSTFLRKIRKRSKAFENERKFNRRFVRQTAAIERRSARIKRRRRARTDGFINRRGRENRNDFRSVGKPKNRPRDAEHAFANRRGNHRLDLHRRNF